MQYLPQFFPRYHRFLSLYRRASVVLVATVLCSGPCVTAQAATTGHYLRLFADNAIWNSRPIQPVLGSFVIPKSLYYPSVSEGVWSSGVFKAAATDPAVTVYPTLGKAGVWDPDTEQNRASIVIPRWPGSVIPASAADGHADIVDEAAGVVHSFWQLKNDNGTWRATQYAWSPLNGRGWGDPAHYYQGARAAAVPTSAGLIRKHEVNNGDTMYRHALAMSLTNNALAANPSYVFPSTAADANAATTNTGQVPEGTLLMLPPGFDTSTVTTPALRKVAETLKVYGAFVVDRNTGTPFVIYVENGSGFSLHPPGGWSTTVANELELLRQQLRPVLSTSGWLDANNAVFTPSKKMNLLSLRGSWTRIWGNGSAAFDSWQQAAVLPAATQAGEYRNYSNRNIVPPTWAKPAAGSTYVFTAQTTGGAQMRLELYDTITSKLLMSTGNLANGASKTFTWPAGTVKTAIAVTTLANQAATAQGSLVQP